VRVAVGALDTLGVSVAVALGDGVLVWVGVGDGVRVRIGAGVWVAVGTGVRVGAGIGVALGDGVTVSVGVEGTRVAVSGWVGIGRGKPQPTSTISAESEMTWMIRRRYPSTTMPLYRSM